MPERVEVTARFVDEWIEIELSAEQLHTEQGKYNNKQEEQQKQTDNRPHTVQQ